MYASYTASGWPRMLLAHHTNNGAPQDPNVRLARLRAQVAKAGSRGECERQHECH